MSRRSPARLLAPIALAVFVFAFFVVLSSGDGGGSGNDEAPSTNGAAPTATATSEGEGKSKRRTYTVKRGDTPSSIAEKTGVPLDRLLELNPDVDPQLLSPGQRLKLR